MSGCVRQMARIIAAGVVALTANTAGAEVEIRFDVIGPKAEDRDFVRALRAASPVITTRAEDTLETDELLAAARSEYAALIAALYARGHYGPVVHVLVDGREAASIAPLDAPAQIDTLQVTVDPGPRFRFSQTEVAPLTRQTELPEGFRPGAAAESGQVTAAVQAGIAGWRDEGHAKADVASRSFTADHRAKTLAARVALNPGPRLRFGPLTVVGHERMREGRIHKIAGLPEGEVFSPDDLERSAERLRRTGVFRSVALTESETIQPPDLLPITATLVEEKPRRYSFGAEIASFEGLNLTGSWLHRNLLGGAERLELTGEVNNIGTQTGGTDYILGVTLDRPATFTPDTTAGVKASVARLNEEDYTADMATFGLNLSHWFNERLTGTLGIAYDYTDGRDVAGAFTYRQLSLPVGAVWDSRNDKLDATEGLYLQGEVKPFQGFGTTGSGVRMVLDARAYRTFGEARPVTLALRGQVGSVMGASLLGTPRGDLFYSGGGGTVRGQPYQSLGVPIRRGVTDFKIGGQAFLAASAEIRVKATSTIGVVGFADIGRVDPQDFFDGGDWHAGAGLGLRYHTGFGPIRLDVAAPVGGNTGDGVQFYIGIGQAF